MSCPYFVETEEEKVEGIAEEEGGAIASSSSSSGEKDETVVNVLPKDGCYYGSYLGLEKLLSSQHPLSKEAGEEAHDEMLFIIVHQVYELWFKQILHELSSVIGIFEKERIDERELSVAAHRLKRVTEIQRILIAQVSVLETMHPMDFLEFRHRLTPASGFQSYQFRILENMLGIQRHQRFKFQQTQYLGYFQKQHQQQLIDSEKRPLLPLVEKWLERTPFLDMEGWDFIVEYRKAVEQMHNADRDIVNNDVHLSAAQKARQLQQIDATEEQFSSLFDEEKHNQLKSQGYRRLSYRALQAALMISLYRDEPLLHLPFQVIMTLVDIDENLTLWRYQHTMMVHRMIGAKMGSGGSSGYRYLKSTTSDRYKVFLDLFNLSSYLIPRSARPELPPQAHQRLDFFFSPIHYEVTTLKAAEK